MTPPADGPVPAMIEQDAATETGLAGLVMLLRLHGIGADAEQIRHRFATGAAIGIADMLRCAKALGLKARCLTSDWGRLARTPLPALAVRRDGGFFILAKVADGRALIQDPLEGQPLVIGRGELEAEWDGRLVLFARRASLPDLARRFDVTWFLQAMVKYRRLLGEVLIASLFLQILALLSPLFFQVVIDKVLVHRALTTLDVLVIGLVDRLDLRGRARRPAHLCLLSHHQPHRRRAGRAPVPASGGACRSPTSRRAASAIRWPGCAS